MITKDTGTIEIENSELDEKLFNFRPVFFVAVSLCFGIVFAYFYITEKVSLWWACLFLPILLSPFLFANTPKKRKRTAISMLALACAILLGFFSLFIQTVNYREQKQVQGQAQVIGQVVEKNKQGYGAWFTLNGVSIDDEKVKGKLVAYLPASFYQKVRLGDWVILQAETENLGENASVYQMENNVRYLAMSEKLIVSGYSFDLFLCIRERMSMSAYNGLSETNAGVALALLLGDTSGIEYGLLENVRFGGVAHVFAVSGLHIGSLFGFCLLAFSKTKLKNLSKWKRFVLVSVILLFYGGICGFSSSVIRAIITCLTAYASVLIGVGYESLETLGFACVIVLLLSPISLFSVGFQLSFLACLGIVLFSRRMQNRLEKLFHVQTDYTQRIPLGVKQRVGKSAIGVVCISLSAQIATSPVLYLQFGYLSGWSILLNFIFTPLISACFSLLLIAVAIACVFPTAIIGVLLYPFETILSALLLVFQLVDFSGFCLQNFALPITALLCYYAGLAFCTDKWNMPVLKKSGIITGCMLSCVFLCIVASL